MDQTSSQLRRSQRTPKPINFSEYDDAIFENDSMFLDEIDDEEGNFRKEFLTCKRDSN